MKTILLISFLIISALSFSQSVSDTSKTHPTNGAQTHSTISNEKDTVGKTKRKKKRNNVNPIEELRKTITNSNTTEQNKNTGNKTDLAITDEGAPADKNNSKTKSAKKSTATQKSETNSGTTGKK